MLKYYKKSSIEARREAGKAWLFLLPSIIGIVIFILIPFMDVIRRSFYEALSNKFIGLTNYRIVFENKAFWQASKNTGRFLITCIPLLLLVSFLLALLLWHQQTYKQFFKTTFLIPMAIPVASIVLLWKLLFHANGLINVLLHNVGRTKVDFINSKTAFWILILTYIWKNAGYDMILWLTGLQGIDQALYEAASVDGAGIFAKFRYITLPKLKPTIFMIVILSFINSFKVFRETYLIAGDYPQESIYMLQHLFNNWFTALDIQKMSATAVLCVVIFLLLALVCLKFNMGEDNDE